MIRITFEDSFDYNRDLTYYVNSDGYLNIILLYIVNVIFGVIMDIVNLMNIQLNELKDKYGKHFANIIRMTLKIKNLVSIDKTIVYKKITTTRKRTIAQKK